MGHITSFSLPENFPVLLPAACPPLSLSVSKVTAMELKATERNPQSQFACTLICGAVLGPDCFSIM